jgi:hypothetical protein
MTQNEKNFIARILIDARSIRFIQFHHALSERLKDDSDGGAEFWTKQAEYFRDKGRDAEHAYQILSGSAMQSITWTIPA